MNHIYEEKTCLEFSGLDIYIKSIKYRQDFFSNIDFYTLEFLVNNKKITFDSTNHPEIPHN